MPELPAGDDYQVKVSGRGYGMMVRKQIRVPAGAIVEVPFVLSRCKTSVEVRAAAPPGGVLSEYAAAR